MPRLQSSAARTALFLFPLLTSVLTSGNDAILPTMSVLVMMLSLNLVSPLNLMAFCSQHQVRKVQVPLVGWHIRAFRQVTKVTEIALIDYLGVVRDINSVHFHSVAVVNKVEECWKRVSTS